MPSRVGELATSGNPPGEAFQNMAQASRFHPATVRQLPAAGRTEGHLSKQCVAQLWAIVGNWTPADSLLLSKTSFGFPSAGQQRNIISRLSALSRSIVTPTSHHHLIHHRRRHHVPVPYRRRRRPPGHRCPRSPSQHRHHRCAP